MYKITIDWYCWVLGVARELVQSPRGSHLQRYSSKIEIVIWRTAGTYHYFSPREYDNHKNKLC